jgi:hypothetical protein
MDLVALVSGKDDREALLGILKRTRSLGIREISETRVNILVHPRRDPGCYAEAEKVLAPFIRRASYALVMFDHEGCGRDEERLDDVARNVQARLDASGWKMRSAVVVVSPELEVWVWSDSPHVPRILGWDGSVMPTLQQWLGEMGFWRRGEPKPARPKEALEAVLKKTSVRRSSAIFSDLASSVSLSRCNDESFLRLRTVLTRWFA